MNDIEKLRVELSRNFADAKIALDKPLRADGFWSMDVHLPGGYHIAVDWNKQSGFGLTSDPEHGYGEPADERYKDFKTALKRTVELIGLRAETVPPYAVRIKELRHQARLSQQEVAARMGVQQAAVCKIENRDDALLSTLQSYIEALGGQLSLKVVLNDKDEEIRLTRRSEREAIGGEPSRAAKGQTSTGGSEAIGRAKRRDRPRSGS